MAEKRKHVAHKEVNTNTRADIPTHVQTFIVYLEFSDFCRKASTGMYQRKARSRRADERMFSFLMKARKMRKSLGNTHRHTNTYTCGGHS